MGLVLSERVFQTNLNIKTTFSYVFAMDINPFIPFSKFLLLIIHNIHNSTNKQKPCKKVYEDHVLYKLYSWSRIQIRCSHRMYVVFLIESIKQMYWQKFIHAAWELTIRAMIHIHTLTSIGRRYFVYERKPNSICKKNVSMEMYNSSVDMSYKNCNGSSYGVQPFCRMDKFKWVIWPKTVWANTWDERISFQTVLFWSLNKNMYMINGDVWSFQILDQLSGILRFRT